MNSWITTIVEWYNKNKRDLPWRKTQNPYHIWVSEIILQQTRIEQGINYYHKFIQRFPDINSLAYATLDDILLVWKGLGYYRRAIYMYETAQAIVNNRNGQFPNNYKDLLRLKGIGKYTASAIASICFDEKVAAIDGNVHRIFCRFYASNFNKNSLAFINQVHQDTLEAMSLVSPGIVNQAMMDFGALICKPIKPICHLCVVQNLCVAYKNNCIQHYPSKHKERTKEIIYHYYFFVHDNKQCYLYKRNENDIWKNLYEFPLFTSKTNNTSFLKVPFLHSLDVINSYESEIITHILSHKTIKATFYIVEVEAIKPLQNYTSIPLADLSKYPMSRLMEKFIEKSKIFQKF
ncbi:MAG: A/G-specific adenine glycosylase [Bacteroidales bacterium]|nr:A/G-specific adenine glycosylase [Bacteroidales bacterium]